MQAIREGESAPSCQVSTVQKISRWRSRIVFAIIAVLFETDWTLRRPSDTVPLTGLEEVLCELKLRTTPRGVSGCDGRTDGNRVG